MQQTRSTLVLTRLVAYIVLSYGLVLIANALARQLRAHPGHYLNVLLIGVPQVIGMGFVYLGSLLLRRKYNAWLATLLLFGVSFGLAIARLILTRDVDEASRLIGLVLPLLIVVLLILTQEAFQVRSDIRNFGRAVRVSTLVLCVALLYGVSGFLLLDRQDFRHNITMLGAIHQTIDQFSLTTDHPVAHTRRARLFMDSLSVISVSSLVYVIISFFGPIRTRLVHQAAQRKKAERLLRAHPNDIDDFFKFWPRDKLYYFSKHEEAGIAYHVANGVMLAVGNPFGDPRRFRSLTTHFLELCFVNDWLPAFIHVDDRYRKMYQRYGFRLQKIGEEAVLDIEAFDSTKKDKYFRQISNRFTRLNYTVEVVEPPYTIQTIARLQHISDDWLKRPGRSERGFMLGYFDENYIQQCSLALLYDADHTIQGFMNVVPTYTPGTANYDLLRCMGTAPGNANDFLLLGLIEYLQSQGVKTLNLGLCPLSGVDKPNNDETTIVDQALRFMYANGDRFYSFSGLQRFKSKYKPSWDARYIAYPGGVRNFTRILRALNRAMKIR